eukprot:EG_transcript_29512
MRIFPRSHNSSICRGIIRAWSGQRFLTTASRTAQSVFEEGLAALEEAHKDAWAKKGPDSALVAKAMVLLKESVDLDQGFGPAQAQYGLSLLTTASSLEQCNAACSHLEKAVQLLPSDHQAVRVVKMGYGDALFALSRVEEALQQYRSCMEGEPDIASAQRLQVRLFFANMALCQGEEARAAFKELPPSLAPLGDGLGQLEQALVDGTVDAVVE